MRNGEASHFPGSHSIGGNLAQQLGPGALMLRRGAELVPRVSTGQPLLAGFVLYTFVLLSLYALTPHSSPSLQDGRARRANEDIALCTDQTRR